MLDREDLELDPDVDDQDEAQPRTRATMSKPLPKPEPDVIIATQRPSQGSAKLLPPILILLLGVGFLGYRSLAADWRGISAFFDPAARAKAPVELALTPRPEVAAPSPAPPEEKPAESPPKAEAVPEEPRPAKPPEGPDPMLDIEREAEATRTRIAELERLKEAESKKLDETADERKHADNLAQRNRRGRFQLGGPANAQQFEAMIAQQREVLKQQMAWMEQMHQRHMAGMSEMEEQFRKGRMGGRVPGMFPGFAAGPDNPNPPRFRTLPPGMMGMPQGGVARFREFRGPNGMVGFEMRWESGNPVPKPPGPGQAPKAGEGEGDAGDVDMGKPGIIEEVKPDVPPPAPPKRVFD